MPNENSLLARACRSWNPKSLLTTTIGEVECATVDSGVHAGSVLWPSDTARSLRQSVFPLRKPNST